MNPVKLLQALSEMWGDLPKLLGAASLKVLPELLKLLTDYSRASGDFDVRRSLLAELLSLLRDYEPIRERLQQAAKEESPPSRSRSGETRRSGRAPARGGVNYPDLPDKLQRVVELPVEADVCDGGKRTPRYVNVCFTRPGTTENLPQSTSLGAGREYRLRLDIGPLSAASVVENPAKLPEELLPQTEDGHWLEMVAVSDDFQIEQIRHHFFLPRSGAGWRCACPPGGAHGCLPHQRQAYLYIPLRAPAQVGDAGLRLAVYYENNLVQSQRLTARIVKHERQGAGHRSWIDYTLTAALSEVDFLPPRTLNILTNHNQDGTHRIVIKGATDAFAFNLTEGQMRDAIGAARRALRDLHIEETQNWWGQKVVSDRYDKNNAKTKSEFIADLKRLAPLGWELGALLFQYKPDCWERLKQPATLQISRTQGSNFVFPWALVYDLPLESDDPGHYRECRLLQEWGGANDPPPQAPSACPYAAEHGLNTICPLGFWGFRHFIEQPPSMPEGRSLPLQIRAANRPPTMVIGRSLNLDPELTKAHLAELGQKIDCVSRDQFREALGKPVEVVYFYTHGRRQPLPGASPSPSLELGAGEQLVPRDIVAWRLTIWPADHWQQTSPLVFINGCHTAELTPESLVNFVDAFGAAYAAGVIGTEISLYESAASKAAEQFFMHFRNQQSVGEALHRMRRHLLSKGNLLGLAYTAYCSTELKLA
jgi:hypothetical protein